MAKNTKKAARVLNASTRPLFVVGGLPTSVETLASYIIAEELHGPCSVVRLATGSADHKIYNENYVKQLIMSMMTFTRARRQKETEDIPTPDKIVLLYVPTADAEALLGKLDFAVFPIALFPLAQWDERGKLLRHNRDAAIEALRNAVKAFKEHHEFFNRLKLRRRTDGIFLPPQNFEVSKGRPIAELFREVRVGTRSFDDRFAEAICYEYKAGDLPKLKDPTRIFRDARDIVFLEPHPTAFHGENWVEPGDDLRNNILLLQSLYRFGGPLPRGFQHDAQLDGGKAFKDQRFNCSVEGEIFVTDHHADVYPNDFVRHRTKK